MNYTRQTPHSIDLDLVLVCSRHTVLRQVVQFVLGALSTSKSSISVCRSDQPSHTIQDPTEVALEPWEMYHLILSVGRLYW